MKYPYFRGLEADRYSFYRVPKALIKVDLFEKMSGDAKLLYAVLLDRMNLSLKNGWQDEDGNAYIICTIDEIMDSIRCARQKAVKLLDELEHEYQLIERRRQGLGKPNLLYVKDLYAGLSQSNYWKYENQTSGGLKSELPGVWKSNGSKTDINNTDSSETDLMCGAAVPQAPVLTAPALSAGSSITAAMAGTSCARQRMDCEASVAMFLLQMHSRVT